MTTSKKLFCPICHMEMWPDYMCECPGSEAANRNSHIAAAQAEERLKAAAPQLLSSLKEILQVAEIYRWALSASQAMTDATLAQIDNKGIEHGYLTRAENAVRLAEKGKP